MSDPTLQQPDQTEALREYTVARQGVADLIRAAKQLCQQYGRAELVEHYQALLVKLAEDRFTLAVVGQFKRGKSSLMNAVIGRDILPTGLLPLTSTVTTLCYGPRERAVLQRKGWAIEPEIAFDELPDYVTEQGNPGNAKGILTVRIELPVAFLRRGLYFVDTPGIGSSRQENTATTYSFLPEADAVIWVTSVEAPLSEAEQAFLCDVRQLVRKILVVVNKVDLLADHERDQVLAFVRDGLQQTLGVADVRLYPLSARMGLEAKRDGDQERWQRSGLSAFEADLSAFLAQGKRQTFLTATLDRALRLAAEAGVLEGQMADVIARMEAARAALLAGSALDVGYAEAAPTASEASDQLRKMATRPAPPQAKGRPRPAEGTCRVCAAQSEAVFDLFAHWQYDLATTREARRIFAAANGFCHVHTWQFQQIASAHTLAEGYAALVEAAAATLRGQAPASPAEIAARLGGLLPTASSCPACRVLRDTAAAEIAKLLAWVATPEGASAYGRSPCLCLPHLRAALAADPPRQVAEALALAQAQRLEELSEDLHSYALKRDALRRGLIRSDEDNAWWYALTQLVGARTAQYQWSEDAGDARK